MPRLKDEWSPENWDGTDWAEEFEPGPPPIADRIGQGEPQDLEKDTADREENSANGVIGDNGYLEKWPSIESRIRQRDRYVCQRCGIDLSGKGRLLHVHHLDGDRLNNESSNLMSLCVICHSDRDRHQHLVNSISPEDLDYLRRLQSAKLKHQA